MKQFVAFFVVFLFGCEAPSPKISLPTVDVVLDDWHRAAAEAEFESYFSYFEGDSSIFMGTDETERWTIAEFRPWAQPYFERGRAWSFVATERVVYYSDDRTFAWFDEELETPNLGPARGSGVLKKGDDGWKIVHYNLSIPIPNAIVSDVVDQIDSTLNSQP